MPLDFAFSALSDPTRRAIVARLSEGEATVGELAAGFPISQPAVSKHLKVLEEAGLIARRQDGARRPCRLRGDRLAELSEWIERYRKAWEANYARLDAVLEDLKHEQEAPE